MMTWERIQNFTRNAWDLWEKSNFDQRIFLVSLVTLAVIFFILVCHFVGWRFANREELRRFRHFANLRNFISDGDWDKRDARKEPKTVRPTV